MQNNYNNAKIMQKKCNKNVIKVLDNKDTI